MDDAFHARSKRGPVKTLQDLVVLVVGLGEPYTLQVKIRPDSERDILAAFEVLDKQFPGRSLTELARELFRLGIDALTDVDEESNQTSAVIASLERVHQRLDELMAARGTVHVEGRLAAETESRSAGAAR